MKEYLSYFSAAALWNIPYFEAIPSPEITETVTVDFTVSEHSMRSLKKGRIIHLCKLALQVHGSRVKMSCDLPYSTDRALK